MKGDADRAGGGGLSGGADAGESGGGSGPAGAAAGGGRAGGRRAGPGRARFWVLAFALLSINGLGWLWSGRGVAAAREGARDSVRITRVEPVRHLERASEFKLVFDRPMVTTDQVGLALEVSPFTLVPAREGRWRWSSETELVYELAEPLPMGRRFELLASPDFTALTGFQLIGEQGFERQTQGLSVNWVRIESAEPGALTLNMSFNQPVAPDDLRRAAAFHFEDKAVEDWRVISKETADSLLVRIQYPSDTVPRKVQVRLAATLCGAGAELGLAEAFDRHLAIPRGFTATRAAAEPAGGKNECTVTVRFSESLALGQETPQLEFTPPVPRTEAHIRGRELRLTGEFECGRTYSVQVGEALLSSSGATLGRTAPLTFQVPERSPDLRMPEGGGLLTPDGQLQLGLRVTNVSTLEVSTTRLHANNLVSHLHGNSTRETSRELEPKRFELDLKPNVVTDCSLSLQDLIDEPLGVYRVTVSDRASRWNDATALVRISDLALTVKRERAGLFVWVTSLRTGQPLRGVSLEARTQNNQVLGRALSSAQGTARIEYPAGDLPDGGVFVVSATLGRDFAYLRPDRNTWVFDELDTAGKEFVKQVDAWLYTECGVYRPGEVMHLTGVLRAPDGGFAAPARYEVRLRRPDGRIGWRGELDGDAAVDPQGLFQIPIPTRATSPTGLYSIDLWDLDADEPRRQLSVNVEEFVPTRLELGAAASVVESGVDQPVEASAPRDGLQRARAPGETRAASPARRIAIDVDARDFLGRPSRGLALRVTPRWTPSSFRSEAHPAFVFPGPEGWASGGFQGREQKQKLDDEGRARVLFHPGDGKAEGVWQLRAAATVTETGGRSSTHSIQATIDTAEQHLGFRLHGASAPVGEPVSLDWRLVAREGLIAKPEAYALRLERVVNEYGMELVNGQLTWRSRERLLDLQRFVIGEDTTAGTLTFEVPESGSYRLLAEAAEGSDSALFHFSAGSGSAAEAPDDPQLLGLTLDRAEYLPGDVARLDVRGEFDGQLLVTLESDAVLHSQVLEFHGPSASIELPLPEELRGGAFVSASLIRGVDPSQTSWLPHRARGSVRLRTDHSGHRLPLALDAPARVAPGQRVTIHASSSWTEFEPDPTRGQPGEARAAEASAPPSAPSGVSSRPARLHVWAVDTGVLLATDERLPDPHAHFFAQHGSGVSTADSWAQLLPDHMRADSVLRIGGDRDAAAAMARRLAALPPTERKSAVAWSRAVDLGPDRRADIELELPEVRGAVTLRAVLIDGDAYSACEQRIELATDLQVTATWPRYATAGDTFRVPVKCLNTTEEPMDVRLEAVTEGPWTLVAEALPASFPLAAGEERTVWLLAETPEPGLAQAQVIGAHAGGEEAFTGAFQVRRAGALHQEIEVARIEGQATRAFDPSTNYDPRGLHVRVEIDGETPIELRPALRALIEYPHGCLEQTTSRLFALVNAGALLEEGDAEQVHAMVEAGIDRLHAMQTRSGGLAYWMGRNQPSAWGSAYAASLLVEARRAGFEVPSSLSEPLMEYLATRLRSGEESLNSQALFCRVLAAFGRPHEGWMVRVQERLPELDVAGRAHLAAAWLRLGRRDRALECLGEDTLGIACRSTSSGRITSQVRQEGVLLSVLIDLDPEHPWIPPLAERLNGSRANGRWRSTLEDAAALCALARYQVLQPEVGSYSGVLVTAAGERLPFDSTRALRVDFDGEARQGQPFTIELQGDGRAHVLVTAEGAPLTPVAAYDRNLQVRRRWLDVAGDPLPEDAELQVGDLIQVEVRLSTLGLGPSDAIDNVAIVDALPAGLEIENPRLANSADLLEAKASRADRVEFREDRVVIFASARKKPATFRYVLRATLAGGYTVPPIQASSMYDPVFASLGDPGSLRVKRLSK